MPGGKGKIRHEDGTPFTSENQPSNRGRKPRIFSQLSKEWTERGIERATPDAVREVYEYLLALTLAEVKDIAGNAKDEKNNYPTIMRVAAAELIGKRKREILNDMLNRAHGGIRTPLDVNVNAKIKIDDGEFTAAQLDKIQQAIQGNGSSDSRNTIPTGKPRKANA